MIRRMCAAGILSLALITWIETGLAQTVTVTPSDAAADSTPLSPGQVGPGLQRLADSSGDRFFKTDSQRMVITGVLTIDGTDSPLQVTRELSGKARIQIGGAKAKTLIFDGKGAGLEGGGQLGPQDLDVLDCLVGDREDYFFFKVAGGAGLRFLGDFFRTDAGSDPNYTGPYFDIYELVADNAIRGDGIEWKRFFFDSVSGLLQRVAYKLPASADTLHDTRLESWQKQSGQFLPGKVTHLENGKEVFTVRIDAVAFGPSVKDGAFNLP